ncbi:MAG: MFS transporter [Simkaniaceae bacterium]|nr:MFS transporter [Simkaniaceae bacterium]
MKNPTKSFLFACFGLVFCVIYGFAETSMASLYILGSLGGSPDTASYSVAFYGVGNALTLPLARYLGRLYGIKPMLQWCIPLFIIMTFISSCASTYPLFIFHRLLQGCASGPIMILITMLLTKLSNDEEKRHFIQTIVIVLISGSILGAAIGGTLAYFINWQMIFYVDTLLLLVMSSLLFYNLRNEPSTTEKVSFDVLGYFYFITAVMSGSLFVILGQELDWFTSRFLVFLLFIFVLSFPCFLIRTWNHPYPVIHLRLLKEGNVAMGLFQVAFLFSAYFGMVILISLWLHLYVSYTIAWVSIVLGIMALSTISVMFLIEYLSHRSNMIFLFIAILLLAISCFYTADFDVDVDFRRIAISRILAGTGFALFLPPLLYLILAAVPPLEGIDGLTLFQVVRAIASGLGTAIYTTIWQRRDVFFHSRLGEGLTSFSPLTRQFFTKLSPFDLVEGQEKASLALALEKQAESLALNDTFFAMGVIMLILFVSLTCFYSLPWGKRGQKGVSL